MRARSFFGFGFWLCVACVTPGRSPAAPPSVPSPRVFELWVDGSAPPGGDGAQGRPGRSLREAVEREFRRPLRVHLATGLYEGPFAFDGGIELVGEGLVALLTPGGDRKAAAGLVKELTRVVDADYVLGLGGPPVWPGGLVRLPRIGPMLTCRPIGGGAAPTRWDLTLGDIELF